MPTLSPTRFVSENGKNFCFAGYPSAKIWKDETAKGDGNWTQHLLFGDYITIQDLEVVNNRVKVRSRNKTGWMNVADIQRERVLEVNFIDIGQGDGCHVVTPDDQHFIIDAGENDNMARYLTWRFNLYRRNAEAPLPKLPFAFRVMISHCDDDHYGGFASIFANAAITVSEILHNGLVQRPGEPNAFGTVVAKHVTSLVRDTAEMRAIIDDPLKRKGTNSKYPLTLFGALANSPNVTFKMLSADDGFVPGLDDTNIVNGKPLSMKVLGPLTVIKNGKPTLPYIASDVGKTKNGHSVLIRLDYGKARLLLGGDINEEAGKLLVDHYKAAGEIDELRVDVAKACHHGSNHFHLEFVEHVNAAATVISSGDEESYSHPRPDAIGALGKWGYGDRPLIFCTELARSNKENNQKQLETTRKNFEKVAKQRSEIAALRAIATPTPQELEKIESLFKSIKKLNQEINSTLTKYGMINVRTDGERMIIAQKLEVEAKYGKWDIHELKFDLGTGRFELIKS